MVFRFHAHKIVVQSRWPTLSFESTEDSTREWRLHLPLPSSLIPVLLNHLYSRPLNFPTLDSALQLYIFASENSNQELEKRCIENIKEKLSPSDVLKVWNHSKCHKLRHSVSFCLNQNLMFHHLS